MGRSIAGVERSPAMVAETKGTWRWAAPARIRKAAAFVALVLLGTLLAGIPWNVALAWESVGPGGGDFRGAVTDTSNASKVTAITSYPSFAYRSINGGAGWTKTGEITVGAINDAAFHDSTKMVAVTGSGCYRSADGGTAWNYASFPASSGYIERVAVDPTNSNKVYASGYKGDTSSDSYVDKLAFLKSVNGGQTWTAAEFFSYDYLWTCGICVSKTNPNTIYICGYKYTGGSYYGALFKSVNGGADWTDVSSSVEANPYNYFYDVAVDPTDDNRVYIAGGYFYGTQNGGSTWEKSVDYLGAYSIGIDPTNTSRLYLGGYTNVYLSTNSGQMWTTRAGVTKGSGQHVAVAQASPSSVYVSTDFGLFKSPDSGATWAAAHNNICCTKIPAMALAPSDPSRVFVEHNGCGVLKSITSGGSWTDLGYFVACGNVAALLVNPSDPNTILALEGFG